MEYVPLETQYHEDGGTSDDRTVGRDRLPRRDFRSCEKGFVTIDRCKRYDRYLWRTVETLSENDYPLWH